MEEYLFIVVLLFMAGLNIHSCYLFYKDKQLARSGGYRISERKLLQSSLFLGGIGAYLGMNLFRHKTQHTHFKILVPISLLLTIAAYIVVFVIFSSF